MKAEVSELLKLIRSVPADVQNQFLLMIRGAAIVNNNMVRQKGVLLMGREKERVQITIRLPSELKERLQKEADRLGVSFNEITIKMIHEGIKSYIGAD